MTCDGRRVYVLRRSLRLSQRPDRAFLCVCRECGGRAIGPSFLDAMGRLLHLPARTEVPKHFEQWELEITDRNR